MACSTLGWKIIIHRLNSKKHIMTTHSKPAGIPCVQLRPDFRCALFGKPERPAVCASLRPTENMCGVNRDEALSYLRGLELATRP